MKKQIIFLIILLLLPAVSVYADLTATSVTLTPASPTTLSNGNSYYLAGRTYSFRVQAVDTAATGKSYWGNIVLTITNGPQNITVTVPVSTDVEVVTSSSAGDSTTANATDNTSSYINLDYQIDITFAWNTNNYAAGSYTVTATVNEANGTPSSDSETDTFNFGISSTISVLNFAQSGVAADGYVNPWHNSFNVTGTIVYDVTGATVADAIVTIDPGEISAPNQIVLLLDGNPAGIANGGTTTIFSFNVTNAIGLSLGDHRWRVRATMVTAGSPEDSPNVAPYYLALNCNRIEITNIEFINGGGTNPPTYSNYYRSVNAPGVQVRLTAQLQDNSPSLLGDRSMRGNTNIEISDGTNTTIVSILSGNSQGTANIIYPAGTLGSTVPLTYTVMTITSGSYAGDTMPPNGQMGGAARIQQTATYTPIVYWDRNDPPGLNNAPGALQTPFTDETLFGHSETATSFRLDWQPVTALPNNPPYDGDFYTYRIYYRVTNVIPNPWLIVDRSTPNYGPSQTYDLSNPATNFATINGLIPFTQYDYFMTAVDVFGQEVEHPIPSGGLSDALYATPIGLGYDQLQTSPTAIEASVTDGITTYSFSQFAADTGITPSTRPLRKTSIRIRVFIVSSGDQPDNVNIILSQDDVNGGNGLPAEDFITLGSITATSYEKISCVKSAPNIWEAYIPSNNRFLNESSYCRFIIESVRSSTSTFSDLDSDNNPNNFEYAFMVQTPTNFQPWPTRVLNNVLTEKNPVCYPAYYLSADAYVTIKAYDVKGRPVATLIDNGFRKGGQNIKEGGWAGDNKSRRKLGVGLYYLRFEAKRASDGKIILNQTEKVVVAK